MPNTAIDYEKVRASIRELVSQLIRPNAERHDRDGEFPRENLTALAEQGYNGILFPKELDGLGLDHVAFTIVAEEIAAADASTGLIYVMHVSAAQTIFLFGSDDQKERWVRSARQGKIGTFSTSERATGGHFWHNVSQAKRAGQDYVIDLEKSFTTSAGHADFYVLTTQTPGAAKASDVTWFIIDGKQPGIKPGPWEALGVRANHSGPLRVENVVVPRADRLGDEGQGKEILFDGGSPSYLLGLGAVWHGVARGTLEETTNYATRIMPHTFLCRIQCGKCADR
jgi:alkylation response protein AidB-like acyl-CoA dehydrogenase